MSGGSGASGGSKKGPIAALLAAAAGLVGIIWWIGPGGGDGRTDPGATPSPSAAATLSSASGPVRQAPPPVPLATNAHAEDEAVLTIITYGLPGRVSPTLAGSNQTLSGAFREQCVPDIQYPKPCVIDYVVKKGTKVTIHAGDSRAGYWPALDSVKGPGCDLGPTSGPDLQCTIDMAGDLRYEAKYYGGESPGNPHYVYPECPKMRPSNAPAWTSRCE